MTSRLFKCYAPMSPMLAEIQDTQGCCFLQPCMCLSTTGSQVAASKVLDPA